MTHFCIECSKSGGLENKDALELFFEKFPENRKIDQDSLVCYVGDFLPNNFHLSQDDEMLHLTFDELEFQQLKQKKSYPGKKGSGYFPEITINKKNGEITIVTDPLGTSLIYFAYHNDKVIISSHLKYIIIRYPEIIKKLDYCALIEYLFSHAIFVEKTFFTKIKLVPNNAIIRITDWQKTSIKESIVKALNQKERWFQFPKDYNQQVNIDEKTTEIASLLEQLIATYYEKNDRKIAFLLSGGLDSRLLIAAAPEAKKDRTEAHTFDVSYSGIEIPLAKKVSRELKFTHYKRIISSNIVIKNAFRHMWFSEGRSNHVISIRLKVYDALHENRTFVDGYLGDGQIGGNYLIHRKWILKKTNSLPSLLRKNLIKHEYAFPEKIFFPLIDNDKKTIQKIINKGMQQECKQMWETNNSTLSLEFLISNIRGRGYILGGSRSIKHQAPIQIPYAHPEIAAQVILIPPAIRNGRKIEEQTLEKLNPKLKAISSTSLKWYNRKAFSLFVQLGFKILKGIESILGVRLVPTYSPVPYFEWLREKGDYYHFVNDILEDPNAIIWNFMKQKNVKKLFNRFIRRKNHYHKFILHIIDLEISLRLFYSFLPKGTIIELLDQDGQVITETEIKLNLDKLAKKRMQWDLE